MSEKYYRVVWEIDLEADSHEEAAAKALAIQRDPNSIATVFRVWDARHRELPMRGVTIDLSGRNRTGAPQ